MSDRPMNPIEGLKRDLLRHLQNIYSLCDDFRRLGTIDPTFKEPIPNELRLDLHRIAEKLSEVEGDLYEVIVKHKDFTKVDKI